MPAFLKILWSLPLVRKAMIAAGMILAVMVAHQVGEWRGGSKARQECRVADLKAELAEMKRQASAKDALLTMARQDAEADRAVADAAEEKVREYEKSLAAGGDCALSPADIKRLSNIR